MPQRPFALLGAAAAALAALVMAPGPQAALASSPEPLRYVALGDSYSAGSGVLPPDPQAAPECARSTSNYPHVLAAAIGARLTDATCGGAETKDYFSSQFQGVAPQLTAVRRSTQLVTMTIGGNDSGVFIDAIVDCGQEGIKAAGQGSPCKDKYGASFETTIRRTTYPALVKALAAVRTKAPRTRVAILGYPWIMPRTGGCFPTMPVAKGDVPYLRHLQWTLNDAVRRAAARTGATYVDMSRVSNTHDACRPIGRRWIEPVVGGTNPAIVHPNAAGEAAMAAQAKKVLHLH